jgi:ferredoxin/flavodoxin---NADP+ reductase
MAPTELNALVTHRAEVAPGLLILRVAPDGWELPEFRPGQFAVLGLPGGSPRYEKSEPDDGPPQDPGKLIRRAYSIASSSRSKNYLEFYVALVSTGALTPRLFALSIGDRVFMSPKVSGILTLEEVPYDKHLVLVATGTGIAPYMSMVRTYFDLASSRRFAVIHGAYHSWDLGYRDELSTLARLCPTFAYIPTLSHPHQEPVPWTGHTGFVQSVWSDGSLAAELGFAPTPADTDVYLCGNPLMIDDMVALLGPEGYTEHSKKTPGTIHVERFW